MNEQSLEKVRAEALFVSDVQRSEHATMDEVRAAIRTTSCRYGTSSVAALVANEFGDHPETAVGRMSWALGLVRDAYPAAL